MGNCCGIRADYISIARDTQKEKNDMNKIFNFDWNKFQKTDSSMNKEGSNSLITVDEILMMRITNDNAQFANPHVAHAAFSEFKKFMFLNKKFIEKEIEKEKAALEEGKKYEPKKYHVGLFAPPVIDSIWSAVISLDIPYGMDYF